MGIQKQAMSGIGTGYDLSTTTFSPDGRVFQVEYAGKAVDASGTVIAVKCKDGIVMAVEKMVRSKLLVEGSNPARSLSPRKPVWQSRGSKLMHDRLSFGHEASASNTRVHTEARFLLTF